MPPDQTVILADIDAILRDMMGDFWLVAEITMDTRFRDDLTMESLDVGLLAVRLRARYGNGVNLAPFISTLDTTSVGELTVGQLVTHIAESLDRMPASP